VQAGLKQVGPEMPISSKCPEPTVVEEGDLNGRIRRQLIGEDLCDRHRVFRSLRPERAIRA